MTDFLSANHQRRCRLPVNLFGHDPAETPLRQRVLRVNPGELNSDKPNGSELNAGESNSGELKSLLIMNNLCSPYYY